MEKLNILIVEDDYSAGTYLREILVNMGYIIIAITPTGEEALNYIRNESIDVVIMDIELEGDIDGIETVKEIKKIDNPYIIYVTALKDKKTFVRAKETFPKYFLSKPFNTYQLLDVISQIIEEPITSKQPHEFYQEYFFVKSKGAYTKYKIENIRYLMADGSSTDIFLKELSHKITLSKNLKNTLNILNTNIIFRVGRSYAININEIESIDSWNVKLFNKRETIVVQGDYRKIFEGLIKKL